VSGRAYWERRSIPIPAGSKPKIADELLDQLLHGRNAQEAFHDGALVTSIEMAMQRSPIASISASMAARAAGRAGYDCDVGPGLAEAAGDAGADDQGRRAIQSKPIQ
jgi:hypothetical protein